MAEKEPIPLNYSHIDDIDLFVKDNIKIFHNLSFIS